MKLLNQRRALIDGEDGVKLLPYGPVSYVVLPAGEHRVLITTAASVVTPGVFGFWLVAVAATVYLLRNLWLWLSTPPLPSVGIWASLRRWISEPPFVREFAVEGGLLRVCEPRIGRRLDVKTREGGYRRIEPQTDGNSIALLLVELSARAGEQLEFDFTNLILRSTEGQEFHATSAADLESHQLMFPNPLYLLDVKNFLIEPSVKIGPSEVVRGYVGFEYSTTEEYPFVHDDFVSLQ